MFRILLFKKSCVSCGFKRFSARAYFGQLFFPYTIYFKCIINHICGWLDGINSFGVLCFSYIVIGQIIINNYNYICILQCDPWWSLLINLLSACTDRSQKTTNILSEAPSPRRSQQQHLSDWSNDYYNLRYQTLMCTHLLIIQISSLCSALVELGTCITVCFKCFYL